MIALHENGKKYQLVSTEIDNVFYLVKEKKLSYKTYFYYRNGCILPLTQDFNYLLSVRSELDRSMDNQIDMNKDKLRVMIFEDGGCYMPNDAYLMKFYEFTQDEVDKMSERIRLNREQREMSRQELRNKKASEERQNKLRFLTDARDKIINGDGIRIEDVIDLCKHYDVPIHPRSQSGLYININRVRIDFNRGLVDYFTKPKGARVNIMVLNKIVKQLTDKIKEDL